ncbi:MULTISPECIES: cellulose-binding domain-containing protein [Saccharothrix]|uniref:cellulose-binding domain-containing protein n=1 Tax=Saccharothrix TaxID=2071 RepID=UPI0009390525|nr:cellulose-binding domain-containing protein [Saccharothrix sp. CB00851]OKI27151.1 cellulose-binding protein [Saccharothrix sp. CB00851]
MRNLLAAVAAVVSIAGLVVIGGTSTAGAAPVCAVDYKLNQWSTGFTANVTVTNQSAPVTSWTLTWTFAGNQSISSGWSADVRQSGAVVTASNMPWNGTLGTGASAQFGFQATYSGTNAVPTDFAFNGVSCSGDQTTTTTTTTTSTSTSTATTTTTSNEPTDCGTAALCDDFEQQTGSTPTGRWTVGAANCTGQGAVSIDNSVAHSGSKSVRVDGASGYCNHIFFGTPVDGSSAAVHGRFYVRHTTALPMAHVTFMAMKDAGDAGKDLRMGGQNAALQWNRESDDATLPEQSPAGVAQSKPLPTGQWNCVQFTVDPAGRISTSLNGSVVDGLVVDGVSTPDIDSQWLRKTGWRPAVTDLRLGWESYGDGANTLWYDDVAVGSSPIAC